MANQRKANPEKMSAGWAIMGRLKYLIDRKSRQWKVQQKQPHLMLRASRGETVLVGATIGGVASLLLLALYLLAAFWSRL